MSLAAQSNAASRGTRLSLSKGETLFFVSSLLAAQSNSAAADSLLIEEFFGSWRFDTQICDDFTENDSVLNFGVHPGQKEYVSFAGKNCPLKVTPGLSFVVANPEKCRKSGFPEEYVGEYALVRIGNQFLKGHLFFTDLQKKEHLLKDCRVHKRFKI